MTPPEGYAATAEGYRAYANLAVRLLEQCATEVRRRRMPLGTRDLPTSKKKSAPMTAFLSYLSAVRTLIHPKSFWLEFVENDREKITLGVLRHMIDHFGRDNAVQMARWAITEPPERVPTWWKNGRK